MSWARIVVLLALALSAGVFALSGAAGERKPEPQPAPAAAPPPAPKPGPVSDGLSRWTAWASDGTEPRRNLSAFGEKQPLRIGGTEHKRGAGISGRTLLLYELDGRAEWAGGQAGLDDNAKNKTARVVLKFFLDGQLADTLALAPVEDGKAPLQDFKIAIKNKKILALYADGPPDAGVGIVKSAVFSADPAETAKHLEKIGKERREAMREARKEQYPARYFASGLHVILGRHQTVNGTAVKIGNGLIEAALFPQIGGRLGTYSRIDGRDLFHIRADLGQARDHAYRLMPRFAHFGGWTLRCRIPDSAAPQTSFLDNAPVKVSVPVEGQVHMEGLPDPATGLRIDKIFIIGPETHFLEIRRAVVNTGPTPIRVRPVASLTLAPWVKIFVPGGQKTAVEGDRADEFFRVEEDCFVGANVGLGWKKGDTVPNYRVGANVNGVTGVAATAGSTLLFWGIDAKPETLVATTTYTFHFTALEISEPPVTIAPGKAHVVREFMSQTDRLTGQTTTDVVRMIELYRKKHLTPPGE